MSIESGKILIVDDNPDVLLAAEIVLKKQFQAIYTESDPANLPALLAKQSFNVVLLDMNYSTGATSGEEGLHWLRTILELSPESKVILMTAYAGVELAINAIKDGATDFVIKPWDNAKLLATIVAAMRHNQSDLQVRELENKQRQLAQLMNQGFEEFIGDSAALQQVMKQIAKVAKTDANVLILGENGTGKELVARAIHQQSNRNNEAFINVDIGAIAQSLFESELFGHKKGAFTDARENRAGRFEVASEGTLFLDEIGNLNIQMQAKLLGALQNMTISRVGSDTLIKVDARLICATNMPLYEMIDEGAFRQDLLYRINTVEIRIPPLRERVSDIGLLAEHFVNIYARKYQKQDIGIEPAAIEKLKEYHWPGNIRELQHLIERAVIMSERDSLLPEDFLLKKPQPSINTNKNRSLNLETIEKETILEALEKHQGNLSQAAVELGLARATLYRKISKYGI